MIAHPRSCRGIACHLGDVTGKGCPGNGTCPLELLRERGVIEFRAPEPTPFQRAVAAVEARFDSHGRVFDEGQAEDLVRAVMEALGR